MKKAQSFDDSAFVIAGLTIQQNDLKSQAKHAILTQC
jgi:hypothetical protein